MTEMTLSAEKGLHLIASEGFWGNWGGAVQCFLFVCLFLNVKGTAATWHPPQKPGNSSIPPLLLRGALIFPQKRCVCCKTQANFAGGG